MEVLRLGQLSPAGIIVNRGVVPSSNFKIDQGYEHGTQICNDDDTYTGFQLQINENSGK